MTASVRNRNRFFNSAFWFAFVSFFVFVIQCAAASDTNELEERESILRAIRIVESSDGKNLIGDNGRAIGPYQIHRSYWLDAVRHDPGIGGSYSDCMDRDYSERIVLAYWDRYAPRDASDEVLARIHNGGPKGHKKRATVSYWNKVAKHIR